MVAYERKYQMNLNNLPPADVILPISGKAGARLPAEKLEQLKQVSTATCSATLNHMGLTRATLAGPRPTQPGSSIVGQAVTIQFMPMREDIGSTVAQEEYERTSALWHVLDAIHPNDILVMAAKGDMRTGCLGEMLVTYLKGRGGLGAVVDGCVRDWPKIKQIGLPLWVKGFTPNYATQSGLNPWAYNVAIDACDVLVMPGDVILADDDGVVCLPLNMVDLVLEAGLSYEDWEAFSRQKLAEGGSIWKYYPLKDEGQEEYDAWCKSREQS